MISVKVKSLNLRCFRIFYLVIFVWVKSKISFGLVDSAKLVTERYFVVLKYLFDSLLLGVYSFSFFKERVIDFLDFIFINLSFICLISPRIPPGTHPSKTSRKRLSLIFIRRASEDVTLAPKESLVYWRTSSKQQT